MGLICAVDLFPVPEVVYQPGSQRQSPSYTATRDRVDHGLTYYLPHPMISGSNIQATAPPFQISRRQLMPFPLSSDIPTDMVYQIGSHIITECSKLTPALIGEKFVEPTLIDYKGKKALVFAFPVSFHLFSILTTANQILSSAVLAAVRLRILEFGLPYRFCIRILLNALLLLAGPSSTQ